MKKLLLFCLFYPLSATKIDLPSQHYDHDSYEEIMQMLYDQKDDMYTQLDAQLETLFESLLIIDPYINTHIRNFKFRSIKKEYKQLKKEFIIISKAIQKIKGK